MTVLSDIDIAHGLSTGYLGISEFSEKGLTPNGYDLRISEISVRGNPEVKSHGVAAIPPRTNFYVSPREGTSALRPVRAAVLRTTWIRKGIKWGRSEDRRGIRRHPHPWSIQRTAGRGDP